MLVRNHVRNVWDPTYDVAYNLLCMTGHQLELMDGSGKILNVNVWGIKVTYPVDKLMKCLPDEKAVSHAALRFEHTQSLWKISTGL